MFWSSGRQVPEALHLAEQAIARDPRYGTALAWGAYCCMGLVHVNRSDDPAADIRKSIDFARRALEVAGDDPGILVNAALPLAHFGENISAMVALVNRALALNPSFAHGWFVNGVLGLWAGHLDTAINHSEESLRLSRRARVGATLCVIGGANFFARRFDLAVPTLHLAIQDDLSYAQPYRYLAACYAHLHRLDDARKVISAATGNDSEIDTGRELFAERRTSRTVPLRTASGDRRDDMTDTHLAPPYHAKPASPDKGRMDAPVLVSASRAVRLGGSTLDHRRLSISPRRQPVRIISDVTAMAGSQTASRFAIDST